MCQDNICKDMTNSSGILTHGPSYFISGSLAVPFKGATGFSDLVNVLLSLSYLLTSHTYLLTLIVSNVHFRATFLEKSRPREKEFCHHLCHYTVFLLWEEERGPGNEVGLPSHRSQLPTNQRARFRSVVVTSVMFLCR